MRRNKYSYTSLSFKSTKILTQFWKKNIWTFFSLEKLSHKNAIKQVEGVKKWEKFWQKWGRFSADFWTLKLPILPIFFQAKADIWSKGVGNTVNKFVRKKIKVASLFFSLENEID